MIWPENQSEVSFLSLQGNLGTVAFFSQADEEDEGDNPHAIFKKDGMTKILVTVNKYTVIKRDRTYLHSEYTSVKSAAIIKKADIFCTNRIQIS